ncbi:hypothetical protein E2562_009379 [Oryza meyeriana var. granulata]|uniref:Uncharacterized protein n=1 Tax=Oryza meyeriana var. granulata TaxID=110450 RepID=A0A6G1CG86_9ORYZ|nr:hypothetical protein E2562_009379 [Oryza meyeriana var. granulata]
MTMAVGVSDLPLPPPICRRRASCHAASPLSLASGTATSPLAPVLSVDEFNEMFFAEYGCDLTELFFTEEEIRVLMLEYEAERAYLLLSHGEVQETAPDEDETQVAPPLLEPDAPRHNKVERSEKGKAPPPPPGEEAENVEVQTPPPPPLLPDAQRPSKKRKAPPPPPGEEAENVEVQTPPRRVPGAPHPSKKGCNKKRKAAAATPPPGEEAENAEVQPPPPQKNVAERILNRQLAAPEPSQGVTILSCQCLEIPRDSPGCPLHQAALFLSWMSEQGYVPATGGAGWAQVPKC